MKQRLFKIFYLLTALVFIANLIFAIRDSVNFSMSDLPEGKEMYSVTSPSGAKKLTVYCVRNSFGSAIRADVKTDGDKRNVYWQTGIDSVTDSGWINDSVININGVELNVDIGADYDCRRGYSIFCAGSIEGDDVEGAINLPE